MIITKILDMLDRNNPAAVQLEGMRLAEETGEIKPFIQPLTPRHSKNVWENCAIIISAKSDEELKDLTRSDIINKLIEKAENIYKEKETLFGRAVGVAARYELARSFPNI